MMTNAVITEQSVKRASLIEKRFQPKITLFHCFNALSTTSSLGKGDYEVHEVKMPCSSLTREVFLLRAFEAGADAVKFQTIVPELFISSADQERRARLRQFRLTYAEFERLYKFADKLNMIFFSTPFDLESAEFLDGIQPVFKIASGDNTFYPLIDTITKFKKPIILSTGLLSFEGIEQVCAYISNKWKEFDVSPGLALLHCVVSFPVPDGQANLGAIDTLRKAFPQLTVGYSDHTLGIRACELAVAAGARIVEKHFTLDKSLSEFRDHQLSADPNDMRLLVERIREVEELLSSGSKTAQPCEHSMEVVVRRSIAVRRPLSTGAFLKAEDFIWVRPGNGIPPGNEDSLVGRKLARNLFEGEIIQYSDLTAE